MLTYKRARAHALKCGILTPTTVAVPIEAMRRSRWLARDVIHPETLEVFLEKDTQVTPEFMQMMALYSGIDYIVCYK